MEFRLQIITGDEAIALVQDSTFVSSWLNLAEKDKKVTVIQEPPFVITWYKQYSSNYVPILCLAYDNEDALVGLMPLARNLNEDGLIHAGAGQAEYHGWIADPEVDVEFPVECLIKIKNTFNIRTWQWRWLPPKAPIEWLFSQRLRNEGIYVNYRTQTSPLWDLNDKTKYEKLLRNKTVRNEINRYKKRGPYFLERIRDKDRTRELIDVLRVQNDFRHEIVHNLRPFASDKNKSLFFIERQNYPDANHFTVLWSNDKPIAFNFGACSRDTVYLGLCSHDPLENKNSPGKLLLLEMAPMLIGEGYRFLDLTPGGDQYKERFANAYQELVEPQFFFTRQEKLYDDTVKMARGLSKKILYKIGITAEQAHDLVDQIKTAKRNIPAKLIRKLKRSIYDSSTLLYYRLLTGTAEISNFRDPEINVQNFADLLEYTESNPWLTRRKLLSEAQERFSAGETLYSIAKEGVLVHYGWMIKGGREHRLGEVDMTFNSPTDSIVLYDFYTEPSFRRQGFYLRNLKQMIGDGYKMGAKQIYIGVSSNNLPSKCAIEKIGFSLFRTFSKRRFLWICRKDEHSHE
jgi:CelD/BcsL family acetyltransferase involved in cellulose biosynthesis/RimJ/RimL family protein N-acetyltransferase